MGDDVKDVRAAAERITRSVRETVYTGPLALQGKLADSLTVADAVLDIYPADDAEPVTEEWLRAVGFKDNPLRERLEVGPAQWWSFNTGDVLGIDHHTGFHTFPTRGHVRHLCKALGIPLTEGR